MEAYLLTFKEILPRLTQLRLSLTVINELAPTRGYANLMAQTGQIIILQILAVDY